MMSVAFKEGLKIPPPALNEIILGANQDVRQVRNRSSPFESTTKDCFLICKLRFNTKKDDYDTVVLYSKTKCAKMYMTISNSITICETASLTIKIPLFFRMKSYQNDSVIII